MLQFQSQNRTISKMETSAFADIIFLLLIFFLLSSSFILPTEIPVNPPDSTEAVTPEDKPIVVSLTKSGECYIDDERVPEADLAAALKGRLEGGATRSVAIRADEAIEVGRLVEIMDLAKEAGAEKLAIATEKKTRSPSR
jgi:biopolymer transport protein ExbD